MVNYFYGVEWEDEFRFKIIDDNEERLSQGKSQTESQTEYIIAYTLYQQGNTPVPYTVTVIDMPGFGDTRGIKLDQMLVEQLRNFFTGKGERGIDHLDAIGFVTQAPLLRLTPSQR